MKSKNFTEDDLRRLGLSETSKGTFEKVGYLGNGKSQYWLTTNVVVSEPYNSPGKSKKFNLVVQPKSDIQVDEFTHLGGGKTPLAVFDITPMGAVRMNKSDTWKLNPAHPDKRKRQRPEVARYFKFKTELKLKATLQEFQVPHNGFHLFFIIPMPHSWSEKKKGQMDMAPHQQKPDGDNIVKAVFDALCSEDKHIWDFRVTKYWGRSGRIIIYPIV